jgi:hypothetical protein
MKRLRRTSPFLLGSDPTRYIGVSGRGMAVGRLLLDEICELCQLRRIAMGRHVLEILMARRARHSWDADAGSGSGLARVLATRTMVVKRNATNAAVRRWTCIVPFRDSAQGCTDKVRIGRGLRGQLDRA